MRKDELSLSSRQRGGYFCKSRVRHVAVNRPEIRVIEDIQEVEAELEIASFAQ